MMAKRGDLFARTLTQPQDFAPAIGALQEYLAAG